MQVKVYRNLTKKCYSVQDKRTRLVARHATSILMSAVEFKVSEAGRRRVLREGQKNVHAFVVGRDLGTPSAKKANLDWMVEHGAVVRIKYNPYLRDCFYREDTGAKVTKADTVWLNEGGVYANIAGLV